MWKHFLCSYSTPSLCNATHVIWTVGHFHFLKKYLYFIWDAGSGNLKFWMGFQNWLRGLFDSELMAAMKTWEEGVKSSFYPSFTLRTPYLVLPMPSFSCQQSWKVDELSKLPSVLNSPKWIQHSNSGGRLLLTSKYWNRSQLHWIRSDGKIIDSQTRFEQDSYFRKESDQLKKILRGTKND